MGSLSSCLESKEKRGKVIEITLKPYGSLYLCRGILYRLLRYYNCAGFTRMSGSFFYCPQNSLHDFFIMCFLKTSSDVLSILSHTCIGLVILGDDQRLILIRHLSCSDWMVWVLSRHVTFFYPLPQWRRKKTSALHPVIGLPEDKGNTRIGQVLPPSFRFLLLGGREKLLTGKATILLMLVKALGPVP